MSELDVYLKRLISLADSKKADDIRVYHVSEVSSLTDYVVILSVENVIHCRSLDEAIKQDVVAYLKEVGDSQDISKPKSSGQSDSGWVIMDLNSVIVHIMDVEKRSFYTIDALYEKGALVYHP